MRALHHALTQSGSGRLIPLATSARSAAALAEDLGIPAENVHAFLSAHGLLIPPSTPSEAERQGAATPARLAQADVPERLRLHPGDVVLVDEAGMAGTFNLDRVLALAQIHGARVRLLGDDRQLAAVESGGALRLIVSEAGAVELDTVHRFAHPGEADAAARLRIGDATGLDHYEARGLVRGGEHSAMAEAAYTGWLADVSAGRTSLLITGRNEDVSALSARARADRVAAGHVEPDGVALHDQNTAGVGDWVVTRENDRRVRSTGGRVWVRNGERFTVAARGEDGSLTARHQGTGAVLRLPADYVARAVELAYASTVHRAQGATVDTAHALITPGDWREALYVAITRARTATRLYVATHTAVLDGEAAIDQHAWDPRNRTARSVLETVLAREASEASATLTTEREREREGLLSTLVPRHAHAHTVLTAPYYRAQIRQVLGEDAAEVLGRDPQASAVLVQVVRQAHHDGWNPGDVLRAAAAILPSVPVDGRPAALDATRTDTTDHAGADGADRTAAPVLAHRLARAVEDLTGAHPAPPPQVEPTPGDRARYARMLSERGLIAEGDERPVTARQPTGETQRTAAVARLLYRPDHEPAPDHLREARQVLDRDTARTVTGSPLWGQVTAGPHRAELLGHDPADLLREAARQSQDTGGPLTASALAERVNALATGETPATLAALRDRDQASRPAVFEALARLMKAHEQATGTDPAVLLPTTDQVTARAGRTNGANAWAVRREHDARLFDTLTWARLQAARDHDQQAAGPLPWVPALLPGTTTPEHAAYLNALTSVIGDRVDRLRHDALTAATTPTGTGGGAGADVQGTAPAARGLTADLARPGHGADAKAWAEAAGVVAAHREQHQLVERPTAAGPNAQVLGPFPTPGAGTAYTHAYWHAAAAVVTARHHAETDSDTDNGTEHDEPRADGHRPADARPAPGPGEVARAHYHQLTRAEGDQVAAVILGRLGALPTPGATGAEDVEARGRMVDEAVTHPANTAHLRRALADLHPGEPEHPQPRHEQDQQTRPEHETDPQRDPTRLVPDGHRVELPPRRSRAARPQAQPGAQPGPRPQTQPAPEPIPEPGHRWDGTPQPGRPYIDPYGGEQPRLRW